MADFKMNGLSLSAPDGYLVRSFVLAAPQERDRSLMSGQMAVRKERAYARNVVVVPEEVPEGTDVDAFAARQLEAIKESMPDFQITRQSTTNIDNVECPVIEAQSAGPEDRLLNMMVTYRVRGTTAFTLSASRLAGLPLYGYVDEGPICQPRGSLADGRAACAYATVTPRLAMLTARHRCPYSLGMKSWRRGRGASGPGTEAES